MTIPTLAQMCDPVSRKVRAVQHGNAVVTNVHGCDRCGDSHELVGFRPLTNPCGVLTHWAPCPTNGEPIMLAIVPDEVRPPNPQDRPGRSPRVQPVVGRTDNPEQGQ
jgi:hypothetical protein